MPLPNLPHLCYTKAKMPGPRGFLSPVRKRETAMPRHVISHTLTKAVICQIEALHAACTEPFPGPDLLGLVLPEAEGAEEDAFYALYYIEETPVSFLSCFCPDGEVCELSGFTAPSFRNRGFFSLLFKEAKKEAKRLFGDVTFSFQCLSSDPDTTAFCKARGLSFSHSECIMERVWPGTKPSGHGGAVPGAAFPTASGVSLRPSDDRALLARLHGKAFDCPAAFSMDYVDTVLADPGTVSRLILADGKPVGLLHLTFQGAPAGPSAGREGQTAYLTGLGILPEFRRRGFAGAALGAAFSLLPNHSRLALQVSTLNTAAFRLYEKLGFEVSLRLDYYTMPALQQKHAMITLKEYEDFPRSLNC